MGTLIRISVRIICIMQEVKFVSSLCTSFSVVHDMKINIKMWIDNIANHVCYYDKIFNQYINSRKKND